MNCHIVPKVYLKQWKIPKTESGIYVFSKNRLTENGNHRNIKKLKDTSFAFENYYILNSSNPDHEYALGGSPCLSEQDEKTIENYFAHRVEQNWKKFLNYIERELLHKKTNKTREECKEFFLEFLVTQFMRREENFKLFTADTFDMVFEVLNSMISDGELTDNDKTHATNSIFFNVLLNQARGEPNLISKLIRKLDNEFQIYFLFASKNTCFITSDNPCFYNNDKYDTICSGVFMPINKNICAFLAEKSQLKVSNPERYILIDLTKDNVKYINGLICEYCIESLAYDNMAISDLIGTRFAKVHWKKSFERVLRKDEDA